MPIAISVRSNKLNLLAAYRNNDLWDIIYTRPISPDTRLLRNISQQHYTNDH